MMIHQFVHTLTYGDAISSEAVSIRRILRELGIESHIYCVHAHEKMTPYARKWHLFSSDLSENEGQGKETAVVLHYSIGSPLNTLFQNETRIKRALIYHNLTPESWFYGYNPRVVRDLRAGREELPELLRSVHVPLADSEFNRQELLAFGCKHAEVLPLLLDTEKWQVPANPGIQQVLKSQGAKNILHVGRFAPNKCLEDIIKAFYFYHHKIERNSKLWLIGSDIDTEIYSFELRMLISALLLKDAVEIVGAVADTELRAFYETCDAYLCMSEHEGFCVPLIEAMYFGLPVVAFGSSAIPDTLGKGGLLLARKSPAEVAELLNIVNTDQELRNRLIQAGKARVHEFRPELFRERLQRVLVEPLAGVTPLVSPAPLGERRQCLP